MSRFRDQEEWEVWRKRSHFDELSIISIRGIDRSKNLFHPCLTGRKYGTDICTCGPCMGEVCRARGEQGPCHWLSPLFPGNYCGACIYDKLEEYTQPYAGDA